MTIEAGFGVAGSMLSPEAKRTVHPRTPASPSAGNSTDERSVPLGEAGATHQSN